MLRTQVNNNRQNKIFHQDNDHNEDGKSMEIYLFCLNGLFILSKVLQCNIYLPPLNSSSKFPPPWRKKFKSLWVILLWDLFWISIVHWNFCNNCFIKIKINDDGKCNNLAILSFSFFPSHHYYQLWYKTFNSLWVILLWDYWSFCNNILIKVATLSFFFSWPKGVSSLDALCPSLTDWLTDSLTHSLPPSLTAEIFESPELLIRLI